MEQVTITIHTSSTVYVCWKDARVVTFISTACLGHSEGTAMRQVKGEKVTVPVPLAVVKYNASMGGVDKSHQYLSYHNVLAAPLRIGKLLFIMLWM